MDVRILLLAALFTATAAVPQGAATWYAAGSGEPDTSWDRHGGRMFPDPDANASGLRVYFNAYDAASNQASVNPNVGTLGGRMPSPAAHWQALLGVWKDCNRDGYIGLAESALREYRVELLPPDSPCSPKFAASTPVFNDGRWVMELLTLGAPDPCVWEARPATTCPPFRKNPVVHYSNGTLVWGDLGAPDANASVGSECPAFPFPRGTTSGTGYLIRHADCFNGHRGVAAFDDAVTLLDPEDSFHLRFGDAHAPQDSESALNIHFPVNLYGSPTTGRPGVLQRGSSDPGFSVLSCEKGSEFHPEPEDPLDNRTVDPRVQDPVEDPRGTGSYWDGAEATFEASMGDCDAGGTPGVFGLLYVDAESAPPGIDTTKGRMRSNVYFKFYNGGRGTGNAVADAAVGPSTPMDLGLGYRRQAGVRTGLGVDYEAGPSWNAHSTAVGNLPPLADVYVTRATVEPQGGVAWTFYARLDRADIVRLGLIIPSLTSATYGAEACGTGITTGAANRNGWSCDPTKWWRGEDGSDMMPYTSQGKDGGRPLAALVGELYDLRDVDCEDGRVAALPTGIVPGDGAYVGLAQLSGKYCA